jgi:hypothetical protein
MRVREKEVGARGEETSIKDRLLAHTNEGVLRINRLPYYLDYCFTMRQLGYISLK